MKHLKKLLSLLLALAMVLALTACGGTEPPSGGNANDTPPAEGTPADNGEAKVLRIGVDGEPMSLDTENLAGGNGIQFVGWSVYGTLWKITTEGEMVYLLAESYDESDDGLTITIHLRDTGFNNGDPFTAEDALFSLRHSDEAMGDRTPAMDLDNSYAEDDKTLVLKLKHTTPTLIDDIGVISMISKSWTEDYTNDEHIYVDPLFCGPYAIVPGWSAGEEMHLVKNENYYNTANLAFDEIVVSFMPDETTRYLSFDNGEYDICYLNESKNIDAAAASYDLYKAPIQSITGILIDTENVNSPYTNQNLRLAMMYAVDVPAIVDAICGDAYTPATSLLPSTNWGYKDVSYGYDPDLAKEYVAKYTQETGDAAPHVVLSVHEGNIDEGIAESVQYYWSQAGIDCEVQIMDFPAFFGAMMSNSMYCYLAMYSGSQDPGGVLNSWNPDNTYTIFDYPDDIAQMFQDACFTADTQENRTAKLFELQDTLKEFGKTLPIYEGSIVYAIADSSIDISHSVQADGYLIPDFITFS